MLQLKLNRFQVLLIALTLPFLIIIPGIYSTLSAQGYDDTFDMRNKIKVEFQYADYWEYEYPEPIVFRYGVQDYTQNLPYLVNFPEKRGLIKFKWNRYYHLKDERQTKNYHTYYNQWY